MNQELYVATLDTRHFAFEAYGESESAAQAAMLRGLKLHARQYELSNDAVRELMRDVDIRPVILTVAYRDRAPLWR